MNRLRQWLYIRLAIVCVMYMNFYFLSAHYQEAMKSFVQYSKHRNRALYNLENTVSSGMFRDRVNLPEVRTPSKQGAFYQLKLGKNNGPFLSKDIMFSNKKSMALLTNKQILKSHQTMVNTIKNLEENQKNMGNFSPLHGQSSPQSSHKRILNQKLFKNQQSSQCVGVEKIENFNGTFSYCERELKVFEKISESLKGEVESLQIGLISVNQKVSAGITNLFESSMPGLKLFFKKIKETNIADKEENYQLRRQLEQMETTTNILRKGLTECESKIEELEKLFNIDGADNVMDSPLDETCQQYSGGEEENELSGSHQERGSFMTEDRQAVTPVSKSSIESSEHLFNSN